VTLQASPSRQSYLRRLATTGAAYTASSVISKLIAVALLPLYTQYLDRADYGAAEVLLATVVALSIVVRLGIIEALLRFYYRFDDEREQRAVVGSSFLFLLLASSIGALVAALLAGPLSEALLDRRDVELVLIAVGGLWVFTNYELLMALFRLDERARAYFSASLANVVLTVGLTIWLVVVEEERARGLLLGNFGGSLAILLVLLYVHRSRLVVRPSGALLGAMLRFGLPTMPAELSL
jgi:O-antigen/teichoic acid export membrane protein